MSNSDGFSNSVTYCTCTGAADVDGPQRAALQKEGEVGSNWTR